jgi:hypothetical protein
MNMTADNSAAATAVNDEREPEKFTIRIGSTQYQVTVRYSENATETFEDKVLRLIEREGLDYA